VLPDIVKSALKLTGLLAAENPDASIESVAKRDGPSGPAKRQIKQSVIDRFIMLSSET